MNPKRHDPTRTLLPPCREHVEPAAVIDTPRQTAVQLPCAALAHPLQHMEAI